MKYTWRLSSWRLSSGTAYAAEVEDDEEDFSDESVAPYVVPERLVTNSWRPSGEPFESDDGLRAPTRYDGQQWSQGRKGKL